MSMFNFSLPRFVGTPEMKTIQIEQFLTAFINELNHTSIEEAQDYVIEQGTSGIWTTRKWISGIAECWAKVEKNIGACTQNPTTKLYFSDNSIEVRYPKNLFLKNPNIQCTLEKNTNSAFLFSIDSGTYEKTPSFKVASISGNIENQNARLNFYAIGRWK